MIEITPKIVDTALLYFHSACSTGNEIAPFLDDLQRELPHLYIWAGDGGIDAKHAPLMGGEASYGVSDQRFWFVFPMHGDGEADFAASIEPMGAVQVTCGGYVNTFVDQVMARFHLTASQVVLCGYQHGACVALAAAMMRRHDPFALTVLFDPWPWEAYYLEYEQSFPSTRVVCVDNMWVREREKQRGAETELYKVFKGYGINAEGVTLNEGQGKPNPFMFLEAIRQIKTRV